MSGVAVVIPSNRPEQLAQWIANWHEYLTNKGAVIIVLWDGYNATKDLEKSLYWKVKDSTPSIEDLAPGDVLIYDWKRIEEDLGETAWIIPRRSDTIRSYGFLKAWEAGLDVWTMDDDVRLIEDTDPLKSYKQINNIDSFDCTGYYSVGSMTSTLEEMRGYPYQHRRRPTAVQYGGWTNIPDFDAIKQITCLGEEGYSFDRAFEPVPTHLGVTGCIMNAYIPHRWIPAMYQLLMGLEEYGVDRYGDIWSGLLMKRVADHLRESVVINGVASVRHERASNPWASLKREAPGFEANEGLWEQLLRVELTKDNPLQAYWELSNTRLDMPGLEDWSLEVQQAMKQWCKTLSERKPR